MNSKTLSIVLTQDQRRAIEQIAKERYGGNMGRAIRAGLEAAYPALKGVEEVGSRGPKVKRKV